MSGHAPNTIPDTSASALLEDLGSLVGVGGCIELGNEEDEEDCEDICDEEEGQDDLLHLQHDLGLKLGVLLGSVVRGLWTDLYL